MSYIPTGRGNSQYMWSVYVNLLATDILRFDQSLSAALPTFRGSLSCRSLAHRATAVLPAQILAFCGTATLAFCHVFYPLTTLLEACSVPPYKISIARIIARIRGA
jgi:hypothetical protein